MTQAIVLSTEQAVAKGWLTLAPDIQAQMGKAAESWSPEQLESAKWYLASLGRGYRTNRYLDACLPQVSPKGKFFLSLTQRDVLYGGGAAGGKALDLSTQIPTPTGFKKLIDVLPGSQVIGRDGKPCDVIAESDIEFRDGWKLIFDDGSTAICSDDHRWLTFDIHEMASLTRRDDEWRAARKKTRKSRVTGNKSELFTASLTARNQTVLRPPTSPPPTGTVRTTAEIVATIKVRGRTSHAIPVCDSVELPPKRLPLDPYLLGCWLGDGHSDSPSMTTMDVSIAEAFIEAGFVIGSISKKGKAGKARTFYFRGGLRAKLRRLSVLRNKHVPHRYLWASKEQRLALLQGLLDTDGTCGKSGKVQFCSTKKQLAESALTLAASLGMKPTIREKRAKLYGKDCGPYWSVSFTPTMPVFRLQRKLRRQLPVQRRVVKFRYLLDAKRIHCRPMKCLVVNSSDRLFLCGRSFLPTHNSTYLLAAAIQYALDIETLVPNEFGWIRIADCRPGDEIYGRDGKKTAITAITDIRIDRPCYRLFFNDGGSITADADHRWAAASHKDRKSKNRDIPLQIVTTEHIYSTQKVETNVRRPTNWAIPLPSALEFEEQNLPIDPYVLGAWLGDGSKRDGTIAGIDPEIRQEFERAGYSTKTYGPNQWHVGRLRTDLGQQGLLNNKHVPLIYLRASIPQRLALLQGLMDTDGSVDKHYGQCRFFNTDPKIFHAAVELVRSLGWQPFISSSRYVRRISRKVAWGQLLIFSADKPVFRLPRKAQRQSLKCKRFRFISRVEPVESVPVRCITVSASDGLFVAGDCYAVTHNCDVPGYSALLIRRTFKELSKGANSLMTRARRWFSPLYPHVRWSAQESSWVFRNKGGDAYLTFGYMEDEGDEIQYQSLEYDFLGVDEVTHQREHQFRYLFSRLRRNTGSDVPPRARAGTNPGGPHDGGEWVKARYVTDEYLRASQDERFRDIRLWEKRSECGDCGGTGVLHKKACVYCDGVGEAVRYFLPARMQDNPFIDEAEYRRSMADVPIIERKQLEDGDWDVVREGKVFRREWLRPWIRRGNSFLLRDPLDAESIGGDSPNRPYIHNRFIDSGETLTFMTADTAYTAKSWSDYTCITIWTMSLSTYDLILRHGWMQKVETPNIMDKIKELYFGSWDRERAADFNVRPAVCDFAMIEFKSSGISIVQEARVSGADGMTIIPYDPGDRDKLARANVARKRFESGQVWFPHGNPGWLGPLVRQLLEFDGIDDSKKDDFVDCVSMAVHYVVSEHNMQRQGSTEVVTDAIPGLQLQGMPLRGTGFGAGMNGLPSVRGW